MITKYHFHMHTHTSKVKIKLCQIHYKILKIYQKYDNQSLND